MGATYVVAYGNAFFLSYDGRLLAAPLDEDGKIMWAGQDETIHPAIKTLLGTLPPNA